MPGDWFSQNPPPADPGTSDWFSKNAPPMDAFQKAVNYRTGNNWIDAPMGVIQGAAKGAAEIGNDIGAAARWATGRPQSSPQDVSLDTQPNGVGQGTGKFLEQATEYALPATEAAKLTKGAGLLARAGAQALVGGGVSAIQSKGDPVATGVGTVLGAVPEVAGTAIGGIKKMIANRAPTLGNFADSFGGATPTQKARISQALPTLIKDGVKPTPDVLSMQDAVKGKLADLGQQYQNLDPAIKTRQADPWDVIDALREAQQPYIRKGVVTNEPAFNAIEDQVDKVRALARANGGGDHLTIDDLLHMKQNANGRTNFQSPDADKSLWKGIGDAYRKVADTVAPETTPLNRDYQKYKDLEQIVDQNVARGKGTTPSGLDKLLSTGALRAGGAAVGGAIGHAVLGGPGAEMGMVAGGMIGPNLGNAARQAFQNAVDSGAFQRMEPGKQLLLKAATKMGDNASVLRLLGQSGAQSLANTSIR